MPRHYKFCAYIASDMPHSVLYIRLSATSVKLKENDGSAQFSFCLIADID